MKRFSTLLIGALLTMGLFAPLLTSNTALAATASSKSECASVFAGDAKEIQDCRAFFDELNDNTVLAELCSGAELGDDCVYSDEGDLAGIGNTIINIFSLVVGIVSVIVIIVAGLRYIVSGGESSNVQGAKNMILYAIVGLVIVVFAQTIVRFVISKL